ncbi:MAG TPA: ATP synthase F1 subunit gamma [Bryobacteraceae bacterium]|nr:ATP synthase F1 subunit gamma [Bryobacteraceae bacterium]
MPSLIDLRRRIRSVKNTQQVTKAMKMVSAAKVRRAQERVLAARPYATMFGQMLADVAAAIGQDEQIGQHPLLQRRPERRILLVLLTSHRGLAGGYNSNLIRAAQSFIGEHTEAEVSLVTIGRKGRDFFRKRGANIVAERSDLVNVTFEDSLEIARDIAGRYEREEIDAASIIGSNFKTLASQELHVRKLLPFDLPTGAGRDYIYEQPPAELLATLLPRYVEITLYQAMLESAASEHAARMVAMEAATKNAGEVIDRLTLYMNRVRQASITNEIIEVVSGAAAL